MAKQSKLKIPPYLRDSPPLEWDIKHYLDAELARHGAAHFDFGIALSNWASTIRHLSKHGEGDQVVFAKKKLEDYKGCPGSLSDKARAKNWRDAKGKKKRNSSVPKSPNSSTSPNLGNLISTLPTPQINYFAPVNQIINGSFDHSPVNFNGSESGGVVNASPIHGGETVDVQPHSAAAVPEPVKSEAETEEKRLNLLCTSFRALRKTMTTTFPLPSGGNLEDRLAKYVMGLKQIDPAHGFIVDAKMLLTISEEDKKHVLDQLEPLPAFPEDLKGVLAKYKKVGTLKQCRKTGRKVTKSCENEDIYWITRVFEQMVRLIENGHMSLDLGEGVLDTLVNSVLWDHYFIDIPDMLLKRKEITLSAMDDEPYKYLSYNPHFDGVFRTRIRGQKHSYELALFEVTGKYDEDGSEKLKKDRTKLLAGCRAMLYRLLELVGNDRSIIPKLRVVGVMQAGLNTQLFIMSLINTNVFHLRASEKQSLPEAFASLDHVSKVIILVWKAKRIIMDTAAAVKSCLGDAKPEGCVDQADPEWC